MRFEVVPRDSRPIGHRESTLDFLQRSSRPDVIQRSEWLQEWVHLMPSDTQPELVRRLKDDRPFMGAYFEVKLNRIFRNFGCEVVYEPVIEGTDKKIDFLVRCDDGDFYVEATVCGYGMGRLAGNRIEDDVAKKIRENVQRPHSHISLKSVGELQRTLSTAEVVRPIRRLLSKYAPDEVRRICSQEGIQGAPSIGIPEDDPALSATLWPKVSEGSDGHVWGPSRTAMCDGRTPLMKALSHKAKDWKRFDFHSTPLVIAVNACHSEFFWDDVEPAIYKDGDVEVDRRLFHDSLSNVSGILVFDHAVLGNEISARVRAYRNGLATIPACLKQILTERQLGSLLGIVPRK